MLSALLVLQFEVVESVVLGAPVEVGVNIELEVQVEVVGVDVFGAFVEHAESVFFVLPYKW